MVLILGFVLFTMPFIVSQTEQAMVLQFGNPIRVVTVPGLYLSCRGRT